MSARDPGRRCRSLARHEKADLEVQVQGVAGRAVSADPVTAECLVVAGPAEAPAPALAVEAQLPGCLVRDPSCGSSISIAHWFALVLQGRLVFGDRAVLDLEAS